MILEILLFLTYENVFSLELKMGPQIHYILGHTAFGEVREIFIEQIRVDEEEKKRKQGVERKKGRGSI